MSGKKRRNPYRGKDYDWKLIKEFTNENAPKIINAFLQMISDRCNIPPENITEIDDDNILKFSIKFDGGETEWIPRNLLLEIATIDRDDDPLKFDYGLFDDGYKIRKIARMGASKVSSLIFIIRKARENGDITKEDVREYYDGSSLERFRMMKFNSREECEKFMNRE